MEKNRLDERFFGSTRGRIVNLLRGTTCTVNELMEKLGLTDNAVRAHLMALESDGLVRQSGVRRGVRKPHFAYELTIDAERLFPKAYDLLLNELIAVLKGRLAPAELEAVLRELGSSLALRQSASKRSGLENRARLALQALEALGGSPQLEMEDSKLVIRSLSCPLAATVAEHPEICQLAEALIADIVGVPVQEHCERTGTPSCRFDIDKQVSWSP